MAAVKAAAVAELERRWRPQEGGLCDEQTGGLQPAKSWRQKQTTGTRCVETPPSASVQRKTVGKNSPQLRRIGQPGRSGSPRSDACQSPSYPPRSAIGGSPGPPRCTLTFPSLLRRGLSLCAVPASHQVQHHPHATASTP